MTLASGIAYQEADLDRLVLPEASFDLAQLALLYIENLAASLTTVRRSLRPGSRLIFSVERPIYTSPRNPKRKVEQGGHKTWPAEAYPIGGPRSTNWLSRE
jgi:ubiquinone/menaquinone biosynthesis C-methylase UbiE